MDAYQIFLGLYVQIMIGTVAFMTIVATLRHTLGNPMPPYQYLIVRFLVEVGMLAVFLAGAALAFSQLVPDQQESLNLTTGVIILVWIPYFIYYMYRRTRLRAPKKFVHIIVILGYAALLLFLTATVLVPGWEPRLAFIYGFFGWVFLAHTMVFITFLGYFFDIRLQLHGGSRVETALNTEKLTPDERPLD